MERAKIEIKNKKEAIKIIRGTFEFFGGDTSHLTDEEIEEASLSVAKMTSQSGVSAEEALETMAIVSQAMKSI